MFTVLTPELNQRVIAMASRLSRGFLRTLRVSWPVRAAPVPASPGTGTRFLSSKGSMNVFNREMKRRQKNWAASQQDGHQYDYLRDEVGTTGL